MKRMCSQCGERLAKHKIHCNGKLRVQSRIDHVLCDQCYRAENDRHHLYFKWSRRRQAVQQQEALHG